MISEIIKKESIEYIHSLTKELSLMGCDNGKYGFRVSGSSGEWNVSRRIEREMRNIGLADVTVEHFPVHSWEFLDGKLEIEGIEMPMSSYCGIKGTGRDGIIGEIIDVGKGTAADYEGLDVEDKIVLCTFDILDDFWISLPVYEAGLRGAKAVVIAYEGDFYGTKEDAINCFDSQCEYNIPVGNISRKNAVILKDMLSRKRIWAKMTLLIDVDFNGESSNVIGYIPGEDNEKMIMLGGHMDGYFHSYQDDLLGVGIIICIAKAMIESGYKPKHTLVFIAHGSEEYGVTGSRYDWCMGSWHNINKIHPEWFGKMIAFFNIDAIRPGTPVYNIASTPEYHGYFKDFMKTMEVPESSWPGGSALLGLNGPWSDDYNYAIKGVPGIICGRGPAEWSYQNYHTQFDTYEIYEKEKEIIQYAAQHYTEMVCNFDKFVLPPFNYKYAFDGFIKGFAEFDDVDKEKVDILTEKTNHIITASDELFKMLTTLNNTDSLKMDNNIAKDERLKLMEVYRLVQGDLKKLSPWDDVVYGHDLIINNIKAIKDASIKLQDNDLKAAVDALWEVDLFKLAYQFDSKTYDWIMHCQDNKRTDLYWGTGKIQEYIRFDSLIKAIRKNNVLEAAEELKNLLIFEKQLLQEMIDQEVVVLSKIESLIAEIKLSRFL